MIAILLFSSTGFQRGRHCLETDLSELQSRGKICDTLPNKNALHFYDALKNSELSNMNVLKIDQGCSFPRLFHTRIPGC